ncbi:hypothetical protein [Arthrobacter sp. D5-1]|uniref:hypothetical protein n=1 Tax=Arthrobacter sp. D5-1 TaxID=1477518 RepID=UPI001A99C2B2|nr:hypothetical protein [Arthrobacter sp. D5-1]QSZ47241.1 hypothetical protein AYX22_01620 [Arthrobacter sp. D5-1]
MADYTYDSELVADPFSFQRAANSAITIYDVADTNNTTPLTLKDLNGLALPNPLTSNDDAFVPAFVAPSPQVKMVGGGLQVVKSSFQGVRDAAVAARLAAEESELAAQAAAISAASTVTEVLAGAVGDAQSAQEAATGAAASAQAAQEAAEAAAEAAAGATGGAAIREDPSHPGFYFVANGGQLSPDPSHPGFYTVTGA